MIIFLMMVGLLLLIVGADFLVRGASKLASFWGVSPLIVGLTVVAFGTSSPELAVSLKAVFSDQAGIAVGNVVGSNIFNVLFILGLAAIITPLVVSVQLIRSDVPLMIAAAVVAWIFGLDGHFSNWEGGILFALLIGYLVHLIVNAKKQRAATAEKENPSESKSTQKDTSAGLFKNGVLIVAGLGLLVLGSDWLVKGAIHLAQLFGVSEVIIGLTIVAAGTSLPEVVTSIMASIRGERDIAVGNVVGSNLFNILGVLGLSSFLAPSGIDVSASVVGFDLPVMVVVSFACLPIFFSGGIISRWEGMLLFAYYLAYTGYLTLANAQHDSLPLFSSTMLYFVIPLTLVTLVVVAFRSRTTTLGS